MAEPGDLEALATRAITLAEDATEVQGQILAQQARSRRTVRMLIGSVAFDVALSIALTIVAVLQFRVSDAIHQSQLAACAIGNEFRGSQSQVWEHILTLAAAPPGETPQEHAIRVQRLADFRAYVEHVFHPVNCTALYGKK